MAETLREVSGQAPRAGAIWSVSMSGAMTPALATRRPAIPAVPRNPGAGAHDGVVLSIVVPTFNEAGNIGELLRRIDACLAGVDWEVVVVDDDSADGTADVVVALGCVDARVRCLRRIGRRGLSGACLEGMAVARGRHIAIMDADLQHDERLLPSMLRALATGDTDLVVGSRYVDGGCVAAWNPTRRALSRAATFVTRALLRVELSDPMSGFFMIRGEALRGLSVRGADKGFKLLLDLVVSAPVPLRIVELPYRFAVRQAGESKLGAGVVWCFLALLLRRLPARIPGRFVRFCAVGGSGVLVHFAVLWALQRGPGASFPAAQTGAVLVSMASNFALNNGLAFADRRLHGAQLLTGLCRFAWLCAFGAVVNVVVAEALHRVGVDRFAAAGAGIVAGAVCNYVGVSRFVWRS